MLPYPSAWIPFTSEANNFVLGTISKIDRVYLHRMLTGDTTLVSRDTIGQIIPDESYEASLSANARYVVFNHKPCPPFYVEGVYARDLINGITSLVSVDSAGVSANKDSSARPLVSISGDGKLIVFDSHGTNLVAGDTNLKEDVFLHNQSTGVTTRVSLTYLGGEGNYDSDDPAISWDGKYVAFESYANNLVPDDTNGKKDIFRVELATGDIKRVSVSSAGVEANKDCYDASISADGRYVAFTTEASNLITIPADTNHKTDVYLHDCDTGTTERVSVANSTGDQGNGDAGGSSISGNGRYVGFRSYASNLVAGDTNFKRDIFVRDRQTGSTKRVSVSSGGSQGNNHSDFGNILVDASNVIFQSFASNLVPGDSNGEEDVFIHNLSTEDTTRISVSSGGSQGNDDSFLEK
jgi:archaellum component FlaF (FlaF/FlaG flagellin family)